MGPFDLLDVTATCDQEGRELCIAVVNRSLDQALPTGIELLGRAFNGELTVHEVNGPDPSTFNTFDQPDAVTVRTMTIPASGSRLDYTFPPHSLTLLRTQLA
jgi:alpha-N-arabinofuranosidase